jgi:hypothetical protein
MFLAAFWGHGPLSSSSSVMRLRSHWQMVAVSTEVESATWHVVFERSDGKHEVRQLLINERAMSETDWRLADVAVTELLDSYRLSTYSLPEL